jgi:DNA modification methylase
MKKSYQTLITRLPYSKDYDPQPIIEASELVDERSLIFISIPIHTESPNNGGVLIKALEDAGLFLVAKICWYRDRHIVTSKRRLTNTWEPLGIFSRSKDYIINRDAPAKQKKGFQHRDTAFDEDEYLTCLGDHWAVRNDRSDRRFLPQTVVLNCAQLADLQPGDMVYDPYSNLGVKKATDAFGWKYKAGDLTVSGRSKAKKKPSSKVTPEKK